VRISARLALLCGALLAACAPAPTYDQVSATLPALAPGQARIFVYRDFQPYQSLAWVPVFLNGTNIGAVGPGKVMQRDLPPGSYTIEAKSEELWPDQAKIVALAPGQTAYAKIESFRGISSNSVEGADIPTFVIVLIDPAQARREIGGLWYQARTRAAGGA
jgi:hypothetical protein